MQSVTEATRIYAAIPQLNRIHENVLLDDVWEQPELGKHERSLVTCAVLAALGRDDVLKGHLARAVAEGFGPTADEMRGLIVQLVFYAGWPAGLCAGRAAIELLERDDHAKGVR
jgi:4-carboxymuconolactone decarboxylase